MKQRFQVEKFADLMEQRLLANEHKGGWRGCTYEHLFGRLIEECYELMNAVLGNLPADVIAREAADVGNFAMMIADNKDWEAKAEAMMAIAEKILP